MASYGTQSRLANVGRKAVTRLREFVAAGSLSSLAAVDRHTGEVVDTEGRALFASLPTITPATAPEELVEHGLIDQGPQNLHIAYEEPKYRVGREIFVRTTVTHEGERLHQPVGAFDSEGPMAFTHRAVLQSERGDDFLVALDGAAELLPFARTDIFSWNEPYGVPSGGGSVSGVQIDYNDPRLKAYVCAGYISIADDLAALDFAADAAELRKQQAHLIYRLASTVRMSYAGQGEGYAGPRAGSLIDGGQGVCFVQRAVAAAFLQAFCRILAFEVQVAVGRTLRLGVAHGFVVITLRPSLARYVCDPAWSEPLTDLPVAFFNNRWGHDRRLEGFEGSQDLVVRPAEIDLPTRESP